MSDLVRLSLSLDQSLYEKLEGLIEESAYTNRSEFIRDLIREQIVQHEWASEEKEAVGTVTLVYDHHKRELSKRLTEIQHAHHDCVLATTHVHLDHDLCAEAIMLKGPAGRLRAIAESLRKEKGVLHGSLSLSSTGTDLS